MTANSRFRTAAVILGTAAAGVALCAAPGPKAKAKVDVGAFIKELMKVKLEGSRAELVIWFPQEFFVAVAVVIF